MSVPTDFDTRNGIAEDCAIPGSLKTTATGSSPGTGISRIASRTLKRCVLIVGDANPEVIYPAAGAEFIPQSRRIGVLVVTLSLPPDR
jgi:hypothetical protein